MRTTSTLKRLLLSLSLLLCVTRASAQNLPSVVTGGADHNLKRFGTRGQLLRALGAHQDRVTTIAVTPNGGEPLVVSGSANGELNLWNVNQNRLLLSQEAHVGEIVTLTLSPMTKYVATAGKDHLVRLWRFANGRCLAENTTKESPVLGLFFSKDGKLLRGVDSQSVWLWRVESDPKGSTRLALLSRHVLNVGKITAVAGSTDGKRLLFGTEDAYAHVWNIETRAVERKIQVSEFPLSAVAFSADGASFVAGDQKGYLRVWSVFDGKPRPFVIKTHSSIHCVALSPDGATVVAGCEEGSLSYWESMTGKLRQKQEAHTGAVLCFGLFP